MYISYFYYDIIEKLVRYSQFYSASNWIAGFVRPDHVCTGTRDKLCQAK